MNFLRRIMMGRNGVDHLSVTVLALGTLLHFAGLFIQVPLLRSLLWMLAYICLFLVIYRTISRNLYRRQAENQRFLAGFARIRSRVALRGRMVREARAYKYLKCPRCAQRLRVPRGKGRIRVSCAKCGEQFERKV